MNEARRDAERMIEEERHRLRLLEEVARSVESGLYWKEFYSNLLHSLVTVCGGVAGHVERKCPDGSRDDWSSHTLRDEQPFLRAMKDSDHQELIDRMFSNGNTLMIVDSDEKFGLGVPSEAVSSNMSVCCLVIPVKKGNEVVAVLKAFLDQEEHPVLDIKGAWHYLKLMAQFAAWYETTPDALRPPPTPAKLPEAPFPEAPPPEWGGDWEGYYELRRQFPVRKAEFPPEQYDRYRGLTVAWAPDASRILESGPDYETVYQRLVGSGVSPHLVIFEDIPLPGCEAIC